MNKIKPCPFCGHECHLKSFNFICYGYECPECGETFGVYKIMIGWKEE